MIEKMKVIEIVSTSSQKENLLHQLRELGAVHIAEQQAADAAILERFNRMNKTMVALKDYESQNKMETKISDEDFETLFLSASQTIDEKKKLIAQKGTAGSEADKIRSWGDFDPKEVECLRLEGFDLHFYRVDKKNLELLKKEDTIRFIRLRDVEKMPTIAVLGQLPPEYQSSEFIIPACSLSAYESQIREIEEQLKKCDEDLTEAAQYIPVFRNQMLKTQNDEEFSAVSNTAGEEDGLVWLKGYLAESEIEHFKEFASRESWAYSLDDPDGEDEKVPTKVKYNKLTKLMIPIFDILGIVPGYREYDISFWFLGFFTLFFAMIVGDAGYGFIFLLGAIVLHVKGKELSNAVMLLYVLSVGTIIWGALTGTWFGSEEAMNIPFLKSLVIQTFANYPEYFGVETTVQQNAIMKFCFIIGVIQLSLACIMNIKRKLKEKDLSLLADLGWLLAIDALYFIVLFLVIGENIPLSSAAIVVVVGFILVVLFGGMSPQKTFAQGLKAGLGDAFTTFLNTISAFGNIMSYIRLFAVGMASLAIAQSFNNMASGFSGPLVVLGILIIIIGHAMNLVMGLLSVVVHGIRLNLLEFSGQLGMEWAGIAYNPFKKLDKLKK